MVMTLLLSSLALFLSTTNLSAQSILSKWRHTLLQNKDSLSSGFYFVPPFDSLSPQGVWIQTRFYPLMKPISLFLSISGALIAFEDSLIKKPVMVEKIRYFPFRKARLGENYFIHISKNSGPHGFIRVWWTLGERGTLLDEIFICLPICFSAVQSISLHPDQGIRIKCLP